MEYCDICGVIDDYYDEYAEVDHKALPKHSCNNIIKNYNNKKKSFYKNREGVLILGSVRVGKLNSFKPKIQDTIKPKLKLNLKVNEKVEFILQIKNESNNIEMLLHGCELGHTQPLFRMKHNPYVFQNGPYKLLPKSTLPENICVEFIAEDIGHFEMPILLKFVREHDAKQLIFVRELVVHVKEEPLTVFKEKVKNPYKNKSWKKSTHFVGCKHQLPSTDKFQVDKDSKVSFSTGLDVIKLDKMGLSVEETAKHRQRIIKIGSILNEGITQKNYANFFHNLLWWDEVILMNNLQRFNMSQITMKRSGNGYLLKVPGLAEKRPSLLRRDKVLIKPCKENISIVYESQINDVYTDEVLLGNFGDGFINHYSSDAEFDVRFLMSRLPLEHMHVAVSKCVPSSPYEGRLFPKPVQNNVPVKIITKFYNKSIKVNKEQRSAVEHIVSRTSGLAPYMVFGPPGTGKTMTIVEAILQVVTNNRKNRVLVCTDTNMAADHIALMLLQYNDVLNVDKFIYRVSSRTRSWNSMPPELACISNGTSYDNFKAVSNVQMSCYKIVVTTLLHAAKYALKKNQKAHNLKMSHLFIDEAAQASEPATLVPVTGLLAPDGFLVLAGDPQQLGPTCNSRDAGKRGLGASLMERLKQSYQNMYNSDPNYITMLIKNFRSDPDILKLPNSLFYENKLEAHAAPDPISKTSILGLPGGRRAVVFHAVNAKEQRIGKSPSFFNDSEIDVLKRYTKTLIEIHKVLPEDIGVITPYIRQVHKIKTWLSQTFKQVEVGTVESFQGKEKRVILVSSVRANCKLLDYDAKYGLGFLIDNKRFNVCLTRAKAKIIIIGNPACLTRDEKWRKYINLCTEYECYFGKRTQQLERDSNTLIDISNRLKKYIV